MCKPASMIVTHGNKAWFSGKTDSHHEIIEEHKLRETDARGDVALVPVEIVPENDDLSRPLDEWKFGVDNAGFDHELPAWWDEKKAEAACRAKLEEWAEAKLKGWMVQEAFHPFNPLTRKTKTLSKLMLIELLRDWSSIWDSVGSSVWDSVWGSVWSSVRDSVWEGVRDSVGNSIWDSVRSSVQDSVWDSVREGVRDSVGNSVYGYIGSLFPNIKTWKYIEDNPSPWKSIRKLWRNGYVPSFNGTTWRLHRGPKAKVVLEIKQSELVKEKK